AALEMSDELKTYPLENEVAPTPAESLDLADILNSLKSLMWRNCGVRRDSRRMLEALDAVDQWQRYVLTRQFEDKRGWELQNMLTVARIMIQAALMREESRGTHLRIDFPHVDEANWNKHIWFERDELAGCE